TPTGRQARRTTGTRGPDPSRRQSAPQQNGPAGRGARRASALRLGTRRTIRARAAPPPASPEVGATGRRPRRGSGAPGYRGVRSTRRAPRGPRARPTTSRSRRPTRGRPGDTARRARSAAGGPFEPSEQGGGVLQQADRHLRFRLEQRPEVLARERQRGEVRLGDDGGGARPAVHQRDLTEEVARDEPGERAAVRVLHLRLALHDHVERVTGLSLANDRRSLHEPLLVDLVPEPLQEPRRHAGEQGYACERISSPFGHVRLPLLTSDGGGSAADPEGSGAGEDARWPAGAAWRRVTLGSPRGGCARPNGGWRDPPAPS